MQELNQMLQVEIVLGFLFFVLSGVVCFFVCRLLLAVAKWFDARRRVVEHDLALNNYRVDD